MMAPSQKQTLSLMSRNVSNIYRTVIRLPYLVLAMVAVLAVAAAFNVRQLTFDASTDTLVAENDQALAYYLEVSEQFGDAVFLILTYQPTDDLLFSPVVLERLARLQEQLETVAGIASVTSVLDAPLLRSPPMPLTELATSYKTLRTPDVDFGLAEKEVTESPLYRELLISTDGRATALRIDLEPDAELDKLRQERQRLRATGVQTAADAERLRAVETSYQAARRNYIASQEQLMADIRQVREAFTDEATIYFSGVPMIASDMIRYVKDDIATFGGLTLGLVMLTLFIFFRRLRWVLLSVLTALLSVLVTAGILGFLRQPVTLISSNFISLLIIFSTAFTVHLIVRYRELVREDAHLSARETLDRTMIDKFAPCVYTALTTIAAFASLTVSDIVPVADLGWIMCLAMTAAFVLNYTFFPTLLAVLPERQVIQLSEKQPLLTGVFSQLTLNRPRLVVGVAFFLAGLSLLGINRLSTDSRFIDYFKDKSEIKQGLVFIDENLGGTTPMDIILTFSPFDAAPLSVDDDFFAGEPDAYPERYWYTPDKIDRLRQMHTYLETREEIGKLISLATLEELARGFNENEGLNTIQLAGVIGLLPDDLRQQFLSPFSVPKAGLMRISMRMRETAPPYSRDALIEDIRRHAVNEVGFAPEAVEVTGVNVLFNNMLKELFRSQLSTVGYVVLATFLMFLILLRSPLLAVVGVVPNLLSAAMVLAFMGFAGITLDMMTMTIAAIIIGIGVDNAIHYLHRFRQEIQMGHTTAEAIATSHRNIGLALYVTSLTVIAGFSVLSLSNFIPTIYFGILTALAMALSLLVNLVVMPSLLMILFRPRPAAGT